MLYQPMTTALLVETNAGEMRLFNDKVSADTWESRQSPFVHIERSVVLPRRRKRHVTIPAAGLRIGEDHPWYWIARSHVRRAANRDSRMPQGE